MKALRAAAVMLLCLLLVLGMRGNEAKQPEVVASCIADVNGDGQKELLLVVGSGRRTPDGDKLGDELLIYPENVISTYQEGIYIRGVMPLNRFSLKVLSPMTVQVGDVTGEGNAEIAMCGYREAHFDPKPAKRPHFYRLEGGELLPVWRGTRLSRPFDNFWLVDVAGDGRKELVSVERWRENVYITAYGWRGFGFELLAQSAPFKGTDVTAAPSDTPGGIDVTYDGKTATLILTKQGTEIEPGTLDAPEGTFP